MVLAKGVAAVSRVDSLYDVLGVAAASTPEQLKRAYRRMLRQRHPDVGGSADEFRALQSAWAILGDETRRAEYDRRAARIADDARVPPGEGPRVATSRREYPSRREARLAEAEPEAEARGAQRLKQERANRRGHPGGSERARYLELLRKWLLDPVPPKAPQRPTRRKSSARFIRRWVGVALRISATVLVVSIAIAAFAFWRVGVAPRVEQHWVLAMAIVGGALVVGIVAGGVIAGIRTATDRVHREVRRLNREASVRFKNESTQYRDDRAEYEKAMSARPSDAHTVLKNPFSPDAVRAAPAAARLSLRRALAQEAVARAMLPLGTDFTVWHDVTLGALGPTVPHLVVGPQGLILVQAVPVSEASFSPAASSPLAAKRDMGRTQIEDSNSRAATCNSVARALDIGGVTAFIEVQTDPVGTTAPATQLDDSRTLTFQVGIDVLAAAFTAGLPDIGRGHDREIARLVEKIERIAQPA